MAYHTCGEKFSTVLPSLYFLVFDGWNTPDAHYVAVDVSFSSSNAVGFLTVCRELSPMDDETTPKEDHHITFLEFALGVFVKFFSNATALIEECCGTNRSVATMINKHLLICASHRFHLAAQKVIEEGIDVLSRIQYLATILPSPLPHAWLRQHTHLCARLDSNTRRTSVLSMLQRHVATCHWLYDGNLLN